MTGRWRRIRDRWLPTRLPRPADFAWPRLTDDDRLPDDIDPHAPGNTTRIEDHMTPTEIEQARAVMREYGQDRR